MKFASTLLAAMIALPLAAQPLTATPYLPGLSSPVVFVQDPLDSTVQYVVQQGGSVIVFVNGVRQATPFLTLSVTTGSERGLLGMAFPPDHAASGQFYVHWTRTISGVGTFMQLSRFSKSAGNPLVADPASRLDIVRTLRPFSNHNAGTIAFGADGYLYIPTGDGGSGGDPGNRSQNPNELLGKMLRIDPRGDDFPADPDKNYSIPSTNPFLPANNPPISALPEIWSFGLRNHWKIRFDETRLLGTGALLIADVGQNSREEVNYEPFLRGGRNYGWKRWEGTFLHSSTTPLAYEPHRPPIHEYDRGVGQSVTGGPIYRGLQLGPGYWGRYFFADYVQGKVFSLGLAVDNVTGEATTTDVVEHSADLGGPGALGSISSIDTNTEGELLVTSIGGTVYRISRPETTWLVSVDRSAGAISVGQVRSLVAVDSRVLVMNAFQASSTAPRNTQLIVRFQTNRTQRNTVALSFNARMGVSLSVPSTVRLLNWGTGQYDVVGNVTLNQNWQQFDLAPVSAATYVSGSGAILARFDVTQSGPLPSPTYSVQFEQAKATVN
jgi:glucose/arabinose dehydrogenase